MTDSVDHPAHYQAGTELEDLRKARWYRDREIARLEVAGWEAPDPAIAPAERPRPKRPRITERDDPGPPLLRRHAG